MPEDNQKQNSKKNIKDSKYQKKQKDEYLNELPESFVKIMKQFPDCFQENKIQQQQKINIPMHECLLKIIKSEQKLLKSKPEYQKQEKRFEKYQKEPYEYKQQEQEIEPEWMSSNVQSMDLNDFQTKTLQYDFKKTFNIKKNIEIKMEKNTNEELFADIDQNLELNQNISPKKSSHENQQNISETSSDNEICFEQLLEKSQNRNSVDAPKIIKQVSLESTSNYNQLQQKCKNIFQQNKQYNKIKLFIDFTRQMTKLDINDNVWYYEDPQKKIQGPFSSVDMDVWNLDQYFPSSLQISWKQNQNFISIQDFKDNPIKILKMSYLKDQKILDILLVDVQEFKKPQGFENYNQNSLQNIQAFSQPINQMTLNNFQISQNNYQLPQNKTQKQDVQINKFFQKSSEKQQEQDIIAQLQQAQVNQQQYSKQNNAQSATLNQNQPQKKSKQIDIQSQPQLLSDLEVLKNVKQDNFQNISENELKKLLGIQKDSKKIFDFT